MIKFCNFIILILIGCCAYGQQPISALQKHELFGRAQGTTYTLTYYSERASISQSSIDSIFAVIDQSMSLYKKGSNILKFNDPELMKMKLDSHMWTVMKESFRVYKDSKGLFDVTVMPLVSLWGFGPEKVVDIPDSSKVAETLKFVGMDKLKLSGKQLKKRVRGVQVDLNGIAQGYTVDVLHDYLLDQKIDNFIVEVGGEIRAHGSKPDQSNFKVLVQRPEQASGGSDHILELRNKSVTTSGSYEKFREVKDYKFSHHIDPKTGRPIKSQTISVTVVANSAMEADAYDNVFIAMKPDEAISFANSKNIVDIYLLYLEDGQVKEAQSSGFQKYLLTDKILKN